MPQAKAKKPKAPRDYPGRLTRDDYHALPSAQRWLLAMPFNPLLAPPKQKRRDA